MKPIQIDFAPPSLHRAVARTRPYAWLAALAGVALCVSAMAVGYGTMQQAGEWQRRRLALREQQARNTPPAARTAPVTEAQASAINNTIARLNLPWRDLFQAIEAGTPADRIALLELSPDPTRHAIKGSAEARNAEDMLAYITRLGTQPFFTSVVLTRHEINEQDPNRPLRFQFVAEWRDTPNRARPATVRGTP